MHSYIFSLIFCININLLGNEGLQNSVLCVANVLEGKTFSYTFCYRLLPKTLSPTHTMNWYF